MRKIHPLYGSIAVPIVFALLLQWKPGVAFGIDGESINKQQQRTAGETLDYEQLTDSLANRNAPPTILGASPQEALFPKDYDWNEQKRVLAVVQTLIDHPADAWSALIDHMDDKRYCLTLEGERSVSNYTVGEICCRVLRETLTAAYMPFIPASEVAFVRLERPQAIPLTLARFRSWLHAKQVEGRSLYELQLETCQWAVRTMPKLTMVSDAERHRSAAKIQRQMEKLGATKKPACMKSLMMRGLRPHAPKRVALEPPTISEDKGR